MVEAITPSDGFTYPHLLSQVVLFSVTEIEGENERKTVCLGMCVQTLGSVPSLIHGDARWMVICSACQLLTAAEALWLARPHCLIYCPNLAGQRDSQPTACR